LRSLNTCLDRGNGPREVLRWCAISALAACLSSAAGALDSSKAPSQYVHDRWDADRGFVGGAVYSIGQSSDGYLWIGTDRGLVRFDGFTFTLIQRPIPTMAPIGRVRGLVTDAEGWLWIRGEGAQLFLYRQGQFVDAFSHFGIPATTFTAMSLDNNGNVLLSGLGSSALRYDSGKLETVANSTDAAGTVISLAESRGGRIWMGTRDGGLYLADHGQISETPSVLANSKINAILAARDGGLWIGTDDGLRFMNGSGDLRADVSTWANHDQILTLTGDKDGNIWAGTNRGLIRITTSGQVTPLSGEANSGSEVATVFEDRDGNLWFGGTDGLERLQDGVFTTYSTDAASPERQIGPIYVDPDGWAWFAPLSGGLSVLENGRIERIHLAGLDSDIVYSIDGGGGVVWVGRQQGGLTRIVKSGNSFAAQTFTQKNGLAQDSVYSILRSRDGAVWAGTISAGLSRFTNGSFTTYTVADGLSSNAINALCEGQDGTLWVGTPMGLDSYQGGRWRHWTTENALPSADMRTCFEDSQHVLWVTTPSGLAFLSNGQIDTPSNLPDVLHEQIYGITEDTLGYMWLSTSDHLVRVSRKALLSGSLSSADVQSFGPSDGLIGSTGVRRERSLLIDAMGRVWVSTNRGIASASPERTLRDPGSIGVRIEALNSGAATFDVTGPPDLPAGSRNVTIHYAGESLSAPDRVRFRYKLDNADQGWSDVVDLRQVNFENLSPGKYRFHVIASKDGILWNSPETTLDFSIDRAYWQTWWFRLACGLAFLLSLYAILKLRTIRLSSQLNARFQERLSERTRIAQELHDTLLQSFQGLMLRFQTADDMLPARPEAAKGVLDEALNRADEALTEGRDAIQNLRSRHASAPDLAQAINLMMAEMNDEFGVDSSRRPDTSVVVEGTRRSINPSAAAEILRLARESLRNAYQHARASHIEAEVTFGDSHLRLRFRDDGIGIDPAVLQRGGRSGHWGMVGVRERALRMGAQLKVWSKTGAGTELELSVPGRIAYVKTAAAANFRFFRTRSSEDHDRRS
jgi:ligand-binding sensor domain-containing protein/signal transduction histidine kinase